MSEHAMITETQMRRIEDVAADLGLGPDDWEPYGRYKAKIGLHVHERLEGTQPGKLIYTTAITATPAGEGKTTIAIGLTQSLGLLGKKVCLALREPSLGPVFGIKGGATGGGKAQIAPADDINLHFNGDIHAVGAAHNLLAALIDNHLQHGNELGIDPRKVLWRRVVDMNDRALRRVVVGLGGSAHGVPRETGFDITVASEIMAILCLASGISDLKERLGRILVAMTYDDRPVFARDLKAEGAMAALLKDALKPNLVQTLEGQPALVHGGPFANIAHGNNSIIATRTALALADYVVTEGGFAADLGAEKFFDIVHGYSGLRPDVAVLVCSIRALNMHGGVPLAQVTETNLEALKRGLANLAHHVRIMDRFGVPVVVAINQFPTDAPEEIELVRSTCAEYGVPCAVAQVVTEGGPGGVELAEKVLEVLETTPSRFRPLYDWNLPIEDKLSTLAREVYGADGVEVTDQAKKDIERCNRLGVADLPLCVAKTQHSITHDPNLKGAPKGWRLLVREIRPSLGAGFLVCLTGDVMTMPGLPKRPASEHVDVDPLGRIVGLH